MMPLRRMYLTLVMAGLMCTALTLRAEADVFGVGGSQFSIDFVMIDSSPAAWRSANAAGDAVETFTAGSGVGAWSDPGRDFRMAACEVTNAQWNRFLMARAPIIGSPASAYDSGSTFADPAQPVNQVSWYEAAQFVNWLNELAGQHVAYQFTGTPGTSDFTFAPWSAAEAADGTNLYRHRDAHYYLPTEDEWVAAAYWNGTDIQEYALPDDAFPIEDVDSNFGYEAGGEPWVVGSGSEELNGTFDMMGNVWEWLESPAGDPAYGATADRGTRGGSYHTWYQPFYASSLRHAADPSAESLNRGFRVASHLPEPATLALLGIGSFIMIRRR